jgi:NADH-ubiquinone oxidoreductase chain 4
VVIVIVIFLLEFKYVIIIFFEFYTLLFYYLVVNDGSSYERRGARVYILFFGYVLRFRLVISNDLAIMRMLLLVLRITKLPMYGLHIWLPKVHAEASIVRSIVLARGVLKLGMLYFWNFGSILMVGVIVLMTLSSLIMVVDRKVFAAYSSVLHITTCVLLSIIVMTLVGYIHIIISPLIFITIYLGYNSSGSRIYIKSGVMIIVLWMVNFRLPFMRGFFAEVYLMMYNRYMLLIVMVIYILTRYVIIKSLNSVGERLFYIPLVVLYLLTI